MKVLEYAVGDIHGRNDLLKSAIVAIKKHARDNDAEPRYIFLGDYVDRGSGSRGVLETLISLQAHDDVICLLGNHEAMMIEAYLGDEKSETHWHLNGGKATRDSYPEKDVDSNHLVWVGNLPAFHETEHRFYVHAGVDPNKPINQQTFHEYLWIRHAFLNHISPFEKYVVHGHSIIRSGKPYVAYHRCGLDTGAVYTDRLSVGVFDPNVKGKPIKCIIVTVDSAYQIDT